MAIQPYTLYSPNIPRSTNELVPAKELRQKLKDFYSVYNPENAQDAALETYLKYARKNGVLALKITLKQKYKSSLDEADNSIIGWSRIYKKLELYYKKHAPEKEVDKHKVFQFAKNKGLLALDNELKNKYGESLSEFMASGLTSWKQNWSSVLQKAHTQQMQYELQRFYVYVDRLGQKFSQSQKLETLVDWAVTHTRTEVNEKLLKKYGFSLDDIRMIRGTTNEERKINLKGQLIEFYQRHDSSKLGDDAYENISVDSNGHMSIGLSSVRSVDTDRISPEMQQIERDAEWGIVHLEELDDMLRSEYGAGLEPKGVKELRKRLYEFYLEHNPNKVDAIQGIIDYALRKGLEAMNEKLVLTYARGIVIDDISI